jgi:hypothetical protein
MVDHTARGKWQEIGLFCSLCEKFANTPHSSQTSHKLVTEHWQEPQVIPNTKAMCINFYFPKRALILPVNSNMICNFLTNFKNPHTTFN